MPKILINTFRKTIYEIVLQKIIKTKYNEASSSD